MKIAVIFALIALACVAHAKIDEDKMAKKVADFKAKHGSMKFSDEKLEAYKKIINEKLPASVAGRPDAEKIKAKLLHKVEMMSKKFELLDGGKFEELKQLLTSRKL